MKKIGFVAGVSFLVGALFFALFFGYFQKTGTKEMILSQPVAQAEEFRSEVTQFNFASLVKKVKPAVVKVTSISIRERGRIFGDDFFDRFFERQPRREKVPGVGSGFLISSDGYIITNNHVVDNAIKVKVKTVKDKEYTARIVGTDPRTDLALLKIDEKDLPFIQLGDSNRAEVGEWVLAIGNPLGQDLSVTSGIISAKGRQLGLAAYEDFLQTDAAINQGNSGGPLINMSGKVIGINSAILAPSGGNIGIGFAIPSDMAKKVVKDLKSKGRVIRGYLGIQISDFNDSEAKEFDLPSGGILVERVEKDSPAEKAGLEKYDLIVAVNGDPVKKSIELSLKVAETSPGESVKIEFFRKKEKKTLHVKVGEAPDTIKFRSSSDDDHSFDLGMILKENSPAIARQYELKTSKGILVTRVDRSGIASKNDIRRFDVILEANAEVLESIDQFRKILAKKKPGSSILLYINRNGEEGMIKFKLPE